MTTEVERWRATASAPHELDRLQCSITFVDKPGHVRMRHGLFHLLLVACVVHALGRAI